MLLLLLILMEVYELGLSDVKHYKLGKLIHNVFCSCDFFIMFFVLVICPTWLIDSHQASAYATGLVVEISEGVRVRVIGLVLWDNESAL